MRHLRCLAIVLALTAAPAGAQMPEMADALDGVDTVILLQQNKEVFGKSGFAVVRGRFRYLFSTAETKAAFEREPAKYEIQLEGMCARMGKTTYGNPSDYVIHDGKIYIFGSDDCHRRFAAAPAKYLAPPPAAMPTSAAAVTKGRELVERVVASMGGAARLDTLKTFAETATQVQQRPQGEVKVSTKTAWRFPGYARVERTTERPGGQTFTLVTVLTPGEIFGTGNGRVFPMVAGARPSLELDLGRHPVAILRARGTPGFTAAALDAATVDGKPVQQVRVRQGALDAIVGIEAQSGQIHSVTFTDRNIDGEVGTYTVIYSDFRDEGGLLLPHHVRALFNGQPDPFQSWTVQSIQVNPPVDAALFTRPSAESR